MTTNEPEYPRPTAEAEHAWANLSGGSMLPGIALDYAQEPTGNRADALLGLLLAAVRFLTETMPTDDTTILALHLRVRARRICHQIPSEQFRRGYRWRRGRARLCPTKYELDQFARRCERVMVYTEPFFGTVPQADAELAQRWLTWVSIARMVIRLCHQVVSAAYPQYRAEGGCI